MYNPTLGRWINRDPVEEDGGVNLYSYVGNNPISFLDPSGLKWSEADCNDAANSIRRATGNLKYYTRQIGNIPLIQWDWIGGVNSKPGGHTVQAGNKRSQVTNELNCYVKNCGPIKTGPSGTNGPLTSGDTAAIREALEAATAAINASNTWHQQNPSPGTPAGK